MSIQQNLLVGGLVLALSGVAQPGIALAQRDAGAKARGEFGTVFWNNRSAQRRMRHARDYAGGLYDYSWRARSVNPQYAASEADEIERNVQAARKNLQGVRKEHGDNKEVLASLDSIEKHLAEALKHHEAFCAECAKEDGEGAGMMSCCSDMLAELDKAIAEHRALMRRITTSAAQEENAAPAQR